MLFAQEILIKQRTWGSCSFGTTLRDNGNTKENQHLRKEGIYVAVLISGRDKTL